MAKSPPSGGVAGRVALITGAGSAEGIGFACAKLLAQRGARVAITSTTARIHERLAELPGRKRDKLAAIADLTDRSATRALVREVESALGPVEILVNNAGMIQTGHGEESGGAFHQLSDRQWDRAIDLNLNTAFAVTRAALPAMRKARYGRIVMLSSVTGPLVSNPRSAGYSAAKAAMVGLTRSLALEEARLGITVNAVGPGWIATASQTKGEARAGRHTPVGRSGTPEEIAAVVAFLVSQEASYLTGQFIAVDGGNSVAEYKGPPKDWY